MLSRWPLSMTGPSATSSVAGSPTGRTCRTPSGSPASSKIRAIDTPPHTAVRGSGLRTTAFPRASAGATERMARTRGKLNGEMTPTTPTGMRRGQAQAGLPSGEDLAGRIRGQRRRLEALLGGYVGFGRRFRRHGPRLANQPALDLSGVLLPQSPRAAQNRGALLVGATRPVALGFQSASCRTSDIVRSGETDLADLLTRCGLNDRGLTAYRGAPLSRKDRTRPYLCVKQAHCSPPFFLMSETAVPTPRSFRFCLLLFQGFKLCHREAQRVACSCSG